MLQRGRPLRAGLHLGVLWAFAFAQPLFEVLGDNAAFFAIRGSEPIDIVTLAIGLVVLPPLALLAVETLATAARPSVGWALHLVFVGLLTALLAVQLLDRVLGDTASTILIPLALAVGALGATAYARAPPVRSFLSVLSPAPLVFLVLFVFYSPVAKLVFPSEASERVAGLPARNPIVMVTFDQFPLTSLLAADGRIDARRYPNFAELASHGYWFRNTAATSDLTELALPAILTGIRPAPDDLPILADHPRNAFTLLGDSHQLRVTESVTHLCPRDLCRVRRPGFKVRMDSLISDVRVVALHMVLPSDLDDDLPSIAGKWQGFDGQEEEPDPAARGTLLDASQRVADLAVLSSRREQFERFISLIESDPEGRPPFYFIHSLLPHFPFEYLPSGRAYGNPNLIVGLDEQLNWVDDSTAVERAYQRHLLQVGYVDLLLGRLLRRLRATGMYDRSLIVVTADHGATFRAGEPLLGWGASTMPDMLPVPLFIKAPGQHVGRTIDAHLQTIDILPTIADLLETDIPWKVDGRSGLTPAADRRAGLLHHPRDEPRPFSFETFDLKLAEGLRRKIELFGTGDPAAVYAVGPHSELLGRRVAEFPATTPAGLRGTIDRPQDFDLVTTRSRFVPAHATGELRGSRAGVPHVLAVAVNGRIAAVARSVPARDSESASFSTIVPETAFREGGNHVELLAVSRGSGGLALASLAETRPPRAPFSLADGEIRVTGGTPIRIDQDAAEGYVDQTRAIGDGIRFSGWAHRRSDGGPVERIVAFAGGQFASAVVPDRPRPDVGEHFKTSPNDLGFRFDLNGEVATNADVDVYAVVAGTASRLRYLCAPHAQVVAC